MDPAYSNKPVAVPMNYDELAKQYAAANEERTAANIEYVRARNVLSDASGRLDSADARANHLHNQLHAFGSPDTMAQTAGQTNALKSSARQY